MRTLLLATMSLAGIAICADSTEARGRGISARCHIASSGDVPPKQTRIMRPAEFVIVRTPRPPSKR